MRFERKLIPMLLVMASIAIMFAGSTLRSSNSGELEARPSDPDGVTLPPLREPRRYDEQGRSVLIVGDLELHIPTSTNVVSTAAPPKSRSLRLGICWPMDELPGECISPESHIHIYIQAAPTRRNSQDERATRSNQPLSSVTSNSVDTEHVGVRSHANQGSDRISYYSLNVRDERGRYVVASVGSAGWLDVFPFVDERLTVHYIFNDAHLSTWPELNREVLSLVESFIIEE